MNKGPIKCDFGESYKDFNEEEFLKNYKKFNLYDFQGSTWAPHLIHKELWDKVGGFSEEFYPGTGSDPDLNMKLWNEGVRIFKGINNCKVYHFGSVVTRKFKDKRNITTETGSKGGKIFILKWGISIKFFKKFYLKSDQKYISPLSNPSFTIEYIYRLILCKFYYYFLKFFYYRKKKF